MHKFFLFINLLSILSVNVAKAEPCYKFTSSSYIQATGVQDHDLKTNGSVITIRRIPSKKIMVALTCGGSLLFVENIESGKPKVSKKIDLDITGSKAESCPGRFYKNSIVRLDNDNIAVYSKNAWFVYSSNGEVVFRGAIPSPNRGISEITNVSNIVPTGNGGFALSSVAGEDGAATIYFVDPKGELKGTYRSEKVGSKEITSMPDSGFSNILRAGNGDLVAVRFKKVYVFKRNSAGTYDYNNPKIFQMDSHSDKMPAVSKNGERIVIRQNDGRVSVYSDSGALINTTLLPGDVNYSDPINTILLDSGVVVTSSFIKNPDGSSAEQIYFIKPDGKIKFSFKTWNADYSEFDFAPSLIKIKAEGGGAFGAYSIMNEQGHSMGDIRIQNTGKATSRSSDFVKGFDSAGTHYVYGTTQGISVVSMKEDPAAYSVVSVPCHDYRGSSTNRTEGSSTPAN